MRNYAVEFSAVQSGQQPMRVFGLFSAPDDRTAVEMVQAATFLRHDQRTQADLYRRETGRDIKIWSGLHRLRHGKPQLKVVGG